jgi:tRNA pseudouridine38-40 synthase
MANETRSLVGERDFRAFRSSADERSETVRRILRAEVRRDRRNAELLELTIEGNHFLHNMVRIIAGTLVDVGRGHVMPGAVERALRSGQRSDLGMTAPPDGLYLEEVRLSLVPEPAWPPPEPAH